MAAVLVEALVQTAVCDRRIEIVERKGIGHPDTICDSLVEAIAIGLNRLYLDTVGTIVHYNIDKALLVAGQCDKTFGAGTVTRPMELIVGDRATFVVDGRHLPVAEVARAAVDDWVRAHLPHVRAGQDLRTTVALAPGSEELRGIFGAGSAAPSANDTGGACGYAPRTPTEDLVLATEQFLNSPAFKRDFPDTGQDVKVLGERADGALTMTVAMPFLCRPTPSETVYFRRKAAALEALATHFRDTPFAIEWRLNCLDRPGRGTAGAYLCLTGTSAEDADSGQVGRGNRVNGLIAFARPAGGEAAAGKNSVAHTGKIYSVLAFRLADLLHGACPETREVAVTLSSHIGDPVDAPRVGVQVVLVPEATVADIEPRVHEIVAGELSDLPAFIDALSRGRYAVC